MNFRIKLLLFAVAVLAVLFLGGTARSALETVSRLDAIEAERDHWQRPDDLIRALDLKAGSTVVDLGCGSGYFSLKLSDSVGGNGRVIAEDIRRLPLMFLRLRAYQKGKHNLRIIRGEPSEPRLSLGTIDAVFIANTYHELADSRSILARVKEALLPGGRLVITDREPPAERSGAQVDIHEVAADLVQSELQGAQFQIVSRQDRFIEHDPEGQTWWLIVARKP